MRRALWAIALVTACGRPSSHPVRTPPSDRPATGVLEGSPWHVGAAPGVTVAIGGGRFLAGSERLVGGAAVASVRPAAAFVACAQTPDGWRFATEDGALFAAPSFDGPLRRVGAVPVRLAPLNPDARRAVFSDGMLLGLDAAARLWAADGGAPRRISLPPVVSAIARSAREILAVVEPGVLRVSGDGGASFHAEVVPAGVAVGVSLRDGVTLVETTAGFFRWEQSRLAVATSIASTAAWTAPPPRSLPDAADNDAARWLPDRASDIALVADRLVVARADALEQRDPASGALRTTLDPPGRGCVPFASGAGLRVRCTHQGWGQAIFAEDPRSPGGWRVLRDELRAEPIGPVAFDLRSSAWAVQSPCAQRTTPDPRAVCLYDTTGATHELHLPTDAALDAVQGDTVMAHSASEWIFVTLNGSVRVPAVGALAGAWFAGDVAVAWGRTADGVALTAASPSADGWRGQWQRAQPGAREAFATSSGVMLAGATADQLWRVDLHGNPQTIAPVTEGVARDVALGEGGYCVGEWCHLGPRLTWTPVRTHPAVLARAPGAVEATPAPTERRGVRCTLGRRTASVEIDRGVAVSGYAMAWTVEGERVRVRWEGERVRGEASGAMALRGGAPVQGRGVVGAEVPVGLLERCDARGCDDRMVTREGTVALNLGRARPGGVELMLRDGGYALRMNDTVDQTELVTVVALDPHGAETARRTFLTAHGARLAHVGTFRGEDGLWIEGADGRMRFYGLGPGDAPRAEVASPGASTGPCAAGVTPEGVVRRTTAGAQVTGDGWYVEAGEWQQEERLWVVGAEVCTAALSGGESKDEEAMRAAGVEEREAVRSFVVTSDGRGGYVGSAWAGRTRAELRCAE